MPTIKQEIQQINAHTKRIRQAANEIRAMGDARDWNLRDDSIQRDVQFAVDPDRSEDWHGILDAFEENDPCKVYERLEQLALQRREYRELNGEKDAGI